MLSGNQLQLETSGRRWRPWLLRALGTALVLKLVALLALKSTFFSAAHELDVTPPLVERHLALDASDSPPADTEPRP